MKLPETYLIEVFRPEAKHILELLTKTKDAQENKEVQNYYSQLADWGSKHLQKAGEIELDKINLSYKEEVIKLGLAKRTKDLWGMINALIKLMKKHSLNKENAKIIQQTTLEILAGLSKMPVPKKLDDPKDPEPPEEDPVKPDEPDDTDDKLSKGIDWTAEKARRLDAAKKTNKSPSEALDKFYNDYYSQEYADVESPEKDTKGIVAKLESLNKILIQEFNKLGYNPEVNPFAAFLKILIKEKPEIFKKLTTNTYGAIHNSFIARSITGNMLGNYPPKNKNILFCSDLYNNNGLDIIEYLALQKQTFDAAKNNIKYSDDTELISKIFIQQAVLDKNYEQNIAKLFDKKINKEIIHPENDNKAKLRSILEIRELYNHLFKTEAKKVVNSKTSEDILNAAIHQNVILDMIQHILAQSVYTDKYPTSAKNIEDWFQARYKDHYSYNDEKNKDSKKILSSYIINADALNIIINKLKYYMDSQKPAESKK